MMKRTVLAVLPAIFLMAASGNALADNLETTKQLFDKLAEKICAADRLQAQADALDPNSREYKDLSEKWYAEMDKIEATTQEENKAYKESLSHLSKPEAEQFRQYAAVKRAKCQHP